MIGDCIHYRYENGKLIFVRQMFQGRTNADVVFTGDAPWIATFQASAFRADLATKHASGKAPVKPITVALKPPSRSNFSAKQSKLSISPKLPF
jgi:electron transfer flavoprotein alpha subunit